MEAQGEDLSILDDRSQWSIDPTTADIEREAGEPALPYYGDGTGVSNRFLVYVGGYPPVGSVPVGALWWCTRTGKTYIYWQNDWIQTNPHGWLSTRWATDKVLLGDGVEGGGGLGSPDDQNRIRDYIYFDDLEFFFGGDRVIFDNDIEGVIISKVYNAPGTDQGRFSSKIGEDSILITRDRGDIPNRSVMTNLSRFLYTVTTSSPHFLRKGEMIEVTNSVYPELLGMHEIVADFQQYTTDNKSSVNFSFFTYQEFRPDSTLEYIAYGENCEGEIAKLKMISTGTDYDDVPRIVGPKRS